MTAQEMKEIALQSAQREYDSVITELKKAAARGEFSIRSKELSQGARELLKKNGYLVHYKDPMGLGFGKYKVSIP